jgi:hypothetical protein
MVRVWREKHGDWTNMGTELGREPMTMQYPLARAADDRQHVMPADPPPVSFEEVTPRDG